MARRLLRLQAVTTELVKVVTTEQIAEVVVDHSVAAIDAKTAAVYLVEPGGTHARMLRAHGPFGDSLDAFVRIPLDGPTPLADVIRTGEPVHLETREDYARRYPISEARTRRVTDADAAILCVPLLLDEGPIGGLVFSFRGARRLEWYERTFLELLAYHCAQAFERARLLEADRAARRQVDEAVVRLQILAEASRAFSAAQQDLSSLLTTIAGHVRTGVGDTCLIMITSADGRHLAPAALLSRDPEVEKAAGAALQEAPLRIGETIAGKVAQTGEPIRVPTTSMDELLDDEARPYRADVARFPVYSVMIVPIRARGVILGVMVVSRSTPERPYTEEDQALLQDLADRAALAIAQVQAYEAERTARERLMRLQAVAAALAVAMTREEVARIAVEEGRATIGAAMGVLYALDPDGHFRIVGREGVPDEILANWRDLPPESNLPVIVVARTGKPVWVETPAQYEADCPELVARISAEKRAAAFALVPLLAGAECLGVLMVGYRVAHSFSETDRSFLSMIAHHCAQALYRARLFFTSQAATQRAEEAARQADEASRLKEEFLATVSHELRTPLSAILGWSAILKTEQKADLGTIDKGIDVIERNARSQLRIIEDILDVSRIIRGELRIETEPVDLNRIGREVLESVRPSAAAKEIELIHVGNDEPCRLIGDSERLRQILWNLLSNAVKFTQRGGMVWLTIAPIGGKMVIAVRDTGRGIDPSFVPHVFERFRQADGSTTRSSGGLGLGLAIVRHLTEMHGGTVTAESEGLGKGATFKVTLPVKAFSAPVRPAPQEAPGPTPPTFGSWPSHGALEGARVLVVEDEDDARDLIEALLAGEGAIVRASSSAEDAVGKVADFEPEVLVSDIGMPGRDGYWLLEEVRRLRPGLPAIALTAFARGEDARRAREAGFDHHLGKPIDPERLVEVVARCLDSA